MRFKCLLFYLIALWLGITTGHSQNCTPLGQNPSTSFPVCGTVTFVQNTVPLCAGSPIPGPCGLGLADINPYWYRFTCYIGGTLGFLITPNNLADDYDWQVFDITGRNPNDVYTDPTLFVACNWSGFGGVTGASTAGTSLIRCEGNVPIFSSMPTLIAGHDYLLLVSHFTNTQSGYQLTFTGGTAGITDPANPIPEVTTASPNCDGTQITVRFNKKVKCNSLVLNGSDFVISPAATILSAAGNGCSTSFDLDSVTLTLSAPLAAGNYTVAAANGSDGNTLLDNCDRNIVVGDDAAFTVTAQSPLPMGVITPPSCTPNSLTITFADPIKCNSVAANGSDFAVIGPSAVTVIGATPVSCNGNGETNTITIQLASSILVNGIYDVKAVTGSDGNTLVGQCNRQVAAGSNAPFTLAAQPPLAMGVITPPPCAPATLTITFTDPINCSSVAVNGSDFVITGPSAATVIVATPVNCNGNGETNTITIQLAGPILVNGTYNVQAVMGSDGNTLIGQCNRQLPAGSSAQFVLNTQTPIAMGTVTPPSCTPSSITLIFAEPITCSSVAANGTDFLVTGPSAVTVTSATAVNCTGGETTTITVQFSAPILVNGNYQVQIATGSDGNTLTGNCTRQVTTGSNAPFTLAAQSAIPMGNITSPPCIPSLITLTFADAINCNSVAANGSDFLITGPSTVTVTSATPVNCNGNGETNTITIQLSAPILISGTYQVQAVTGSDGNTLIGQCNRQVTVGSNSSFTLAAQTPIAMGTITPPPCTPTTITLTFADPIKCNSVAANGSDFVITGPSAVTVTGETAVNCNGNGETNTITIQFSTPILVSGSYQVQAATGSDGNTLIGQCNRQVTAGSSSAFMLVPQPPIAMGTVPQPSCSPSSVVINFTDLINCQSIASNGSDFLITGPSGVTINGAVGTCNTNQQTNSITISLSAPIITSGVYQLHMATGTDGNTLTGDCNRQTTAGDLASFTIPAAQPVLMDSIVPVSCSPSSLRLIFDNPVKCSSVAADGSDFTVTAGPSPVNVVSASGTCDANGLTTIIDIRLASAIAVGGTYQLQLIAGSDGNTLLSDCNRQTPASALSFLASDTVSAAFQYQVQYDCQTDVISFSHDGQHNVNQWTWTVNNTVGGSMQTFTQNFSASSQNQVKLVVSNGVCSDTHTENIVLNNKVTAAFKGPDVICPEDSAIFINNSTGGIDTWQWNFGNGNSSALQYPPGQVYPLTGTEIFYTVSLTVSNNSGCQTTATQPVKVLSGCIIAVPTAFTPNNDGLNDYLFPINAIKAEKLDFKVFNRWGEMIFHSRDWTQKWDGKINGIMQGTNVYVWTLDYTHRDTKIKYSLKGTTTLIR